MDALALLSRDRPFRSMTLSSRSQSNPDLGGYRRQPFSLILGTSWAISAILGFLPPLLHFLQMVRYEVFLWLSMTHNSHFDIPTGSDRHVPSRARRGACRKAERCPMDMPIMLADHQPFLKLLKLWTELQG